MGKRKGNGRPKKGFRSTFESNANDYFNRANVPFDYETLKLPYTLNLTYKPDFSRTKKDGSLMILEYKGFFDSSDRQKMKAVKEQHPELDIRLVFMADNKIYPRSKTRYSDWATENGFPFYVVPKKSKRMIEPSWLEE